MADFLFKNPVTPAWPELQWRNLAQGSFNYRTLGSGNVSTVLFAGEKGILKGVWLDDYNNAPLTFSASGGIGSHGTFGSATIEPGWTPTWLSFEGTLSVNTGTAQLFGALIGTGLGPLQW